MDALQQHAVVSERAFVRDRRGAAVWVGVLRASFEVDGDGKVSRAERQTPPRRAALWWGEPGRSSLREEEDFKALRGTDVLVEGEAMAASGRRVASVDVSLRCGERQKVLRVYGSRRWLRSARGSEIVPGPAEALERLPLRYEHAFGGTDPHAPVGSATTCTANPMGVGYSHQPERLIGTIAPSIRRVG